MKKQFYLLICFLLSVYLIRFTWNYYSVPNSNYKSVCVEFVNNVFQKSFIGPSLPKSQQRLENLFTALSPGLFYCQKNPFLRGLDRKVVERYEQRYYQWRSTGQLTRLYMLLTDYFYSEGVHPENFSSEDGHFMTYHTQIGKLIENVIYPKDEAFPCKAGLKEYGNKILCALEGLNETDGCVIYSFGSNNNFDFEEKVSASTKCRIFIFDCTSSPPKTHIERVLFHKKCVGLPKKPGDLNRTLQIRLFPYPRPPRGWNSAAAVPLIQSIQLESYHTILKLLEQSQVHVLKLDVEGAEYGLFVDLLEQNTTRESLPYQLSFETHWWHRDIGHAMLTLQMFEELWRAGYRFVSHVPQQDSSCFEWTAIRVFC